MLAKLRAVLSRIRGLFAGGRLDSDFEQEMESHLALLAEENTRTGMTPDEARRAARLKLGSAVQLRETHHAQRTLPWLESMWQDSRFAVRMLRKNPGFATIAILTLALGIGANTAIFSVVDAILLRPLPYSQPGSLVRIWNTYLPAWPQLGLSPGDFQDLRQQARDFSEMGAYVNLPQVNGFNLTGQGDPQRVTAAYATSAFFPMLGLRAIAGRFFNPEEDGPGVAPVAVIGYRLWQTTFHGDPTVVGRTIALDGQGYALIGIAPEEIDRIDRADLWMPVGQYQDDLAGRIHHPFTTVARLNPGVTIAQAQADLDTLNRKVALSFPDTHKNWGIAVEPMQDPAAANLRLALLALLGAVALVLLIACANSVNLLLARNAARRKEIGMRIALGAGRRRLIRQLLTESVLLAVAGGTLGLLIAAATLRGIQMLAPADLLNRNAIALNGTVLAFTMLVCLITGLVCGAIPAFQTLRGDLYSVFKEGGSTTSTSDSQRLRGSLVVAEIALALMPLMCAGLLIRSFRRLLEVSPGFRTDHALVMNVTLPAVPLSTINKLTPAQQLDLGRKQSLEFQEVADALRTLPGVENVGGVNVLPLASAMASASRFLIEGQPAPSMGARASAETRSVSLGYFATMGIPLIRGRALGAGDYTLQNIVINEEMARRFWGSKDPTGARINLCSLAPQPCWFTIVGVVGNVHEYGLEKSTTFDVYSAGGWTPYIIMRTAADPTALAAAAVQEIHKIEPTLPVTDVRTLDSLLDDSVSTRRFSTVLFGSFAALALLLAAVGVYGVMNYAVSVRTSEIGIRVALGAQRSDVWRLVFGRSAMLAATGIVIGIAGTLGASRYIAALLFAVKPADPLTLFGAALLLFAVAMAACYVPVRRAMRVDPMVALRHE